MKTPLFALALLAAACGNSDNLIVGDVASGDTTPEVLFDNLQSAIHGILTPRDSAGNPVGDPVLVVMLSSTPNLCGKLKATPDYFRNAPEAYQSLILYLPSDSPCHPGQGVRLGTFVIGRDCDLGTAAQIIATSGPQVTTPFNGLTGSDIELTNWSLSDNATGSFGNYFGMFFDDPYGSGLAHPFQGRFKTVPCATLEGTLLP
jgi:hypothetical protein